VTISPDIAARMGIVRYSVAEYYTSRRNTVCRINAVKADRTEISFVYKIYQCGDINREAQMLDKLRGGGRVPRILMRGRDALCLEFLPGKTLLDVLEEKERAAQSPHAAIDRLLDFLAYFYAEVPGCKYGDVNLRNFIDTERGICGVDMEETAEGMPYTDIGRMAAFLLTYRPAYTAYKKDAVDYLIHTGAQRLGFSVREAEAAKRDEFSAMEARRKDKK
jgi:hypothetical protein